MASTDVNSFNYVSNDNDDDEMFNMNSLDLDYNLFNSLFSFFPMLLPEEISIFKVNN